MAILGAGATVGGASAFMWHPLLPQQSVDGLGFHLLFAHHQHFFTAFRPSLHLALGVMRTAMKCIKHQFSFLEINCASMPHKQCFYSLQHFYTDGPKVGS